MLCKTVFRILWFSLYFFPKEFFVYICKYIIIYISIHTLLWGVIHFYQI